MRAQVGVVAGARGTRCRVTVLKRVSELLLSA